MKGARSVVLILMCVLLLAFYEQLPTIAYQTKSKTLDIVSTYGYDFGYESIMISSSLHLRNDNNIIYSEFRNVGKLGLGDLGDRYLVCRSIPSFDLVWEYETDTVSSTYESTPQHLFVNDTKITDKTSWECIYLCKCLDIASGIQLWAKENYSCIHANPIYALFENDVNSTIEFVTNEEIKWRYELDSDSNYSFACNEVNILLIVEEEKIEETWIERLDNQTGEILWDMDISSVMNIEHLNQSVTDNNIYLWDDHSMICLDANSGNTKWNYAFENRLIDSIIEQENYVCLFDRYFGLICLDNLSGDLVWMYQCQSSPSFVGEDGQYFNNIYATLEGGKLLIIPSPQNELQILDFSTGLVTSMYSINYAHIDIFGDFICSDCYISVLSALNIYILKIPHTRMKFVVGDNYYQIDGESIDMDVSPTVINDRTLLPARYVVEPLGGQVFWDGEQRKVTCKLVAPDNADTEEYKENIVELWIDMPTARVNGSVIPIDPDNPDVVPTIINDRTMVPMRFLAESLGCEVEWVADTKEIILTYTP